MTPDTAIEIPPTKFHIGQQVFFLFENSVNTSVKTGKITEIHIYEVKNKCDFIKYSISFDDDQVYYLQDDDIFLTKIEAKKHQQTVKLDKINRLKKEKNRLKKEKAQILEDIKIYSEKLEKVKDVQFVKCPPFTKNIKIGSKLWLIDYHLNLQQVEVTQVHKTVTEKGVISDSFEVDNISKMFSLKDINQVGNNMFFPPLFESEKLAEANLPFVQRNYFQKELEYLQDKIACIKAVEQI